MSEILTLSLEPIKVSYQIGDTTYELREATEGVACKYQNALMKRVKMGENGLPTSADGVADTEPYLVSLCLFDSSGYPVTDATIRTWPSRVVKTLFDKVMEISQLNGDTVEAIKKQIVTLEKRLADKMGESSPKKLQPDTEGISD